MVVFPRLLITTVPTHAPIGLAIDLNQLLTLVVLSLGKVLSRFFVKGRPLLGYDYLLLPTRACAPRRDSIFNRFRFRRPCDPLS
jgi:hypothetical protein